MHQILVSTLVRQFKSKRNRMNAAKFNDQPKIERLVTYNLRINRNLIITHVSSNTPRFSSTKLEAHKGVARVRNRVFMTRPWTEHRTADDYADVVHRYGFPGIYKIAPVSPLSSSASPRDDAWTKKSVAGSLAELCLGSEVADIGWNTIARLSNARGKRGGGGGGGDVKPWYLEMGCLADLSCSGIRQFNHSSRWNFLEIFVPLASCALCCESKSYEFLGKWSVFAWSKPPGFFE